MRSTSSSATWHGSQRESSSPTSISVARTTDSRSSPAESPFTRVDGAGPTAFAASARDVTKRREREEPVKEAEAKYRTLVEQLPLATYINATGMPVRTRYVSPQIEAML